MKTHGLTKHPLYKVWELMRARCYNFNDTHFKEYGARGIIVCEEWRLSFKAFYDWAIENGWEKGLEVDRYPDNSGNYEPSNCRIATSKQNCRNRRSNRLITYNGITKPLIDWSEETGINYHVLHGRLKCNWDINDLFNPVRKRTPNSQAKN